GADMTTDPTIVKDWVRPSGYGNGWSQRLISPSFSYASHPGAVFQFDAWMDLDDDAGPQTHDVLDSTGASNEFISIQGLRADGTWATLAFRRSSHLSNVFA